MSSLSVEQQVRQRALDQALTAVPGTGTGSIIAVANEFANFVLDGAERVDAETGKNATGKSKAESRKSSSSKKISTPPEEAPPAAPAAEEASSEATDTAPGVAEESPSTSDDHSDAVDKESVRKALVGLGKLLNDGNKKAQEIMLKVGGAQTIGGIDPSKYATILAEVTKASKKAAATPPSDDGLGD